MIPVLFKEDEQVFSHNGIGALYESLSCDVIEEENGAFTMELEYPVDGELFSEIKDFRIIQAKPNDIDDPHNFRIYEIVKSIDELTVYVRANTRTNDLGNNLITNYAAKDITPQQAMNGIKSSLIETTNFDLISDIQTKSNVEWTRINPLNAIVGTRGSLVDIWGGEIKRTNTAIHLYSRRGRDNVVTIRPGKNIEGLNMTVSTAGLVTKILPTYTYRPVDVPKYQMVTRSDGSKEKQRVTASGSTTIRDDITVLGDVVSSQYADNYPMNYWISVDYDDDDELKDKVNNYIDTRLSAAEDSPTIINMSGFENDVKNFVKTELDKKAKQYFTHRNPGADKPTVRISVDMLQLSDSPDWEEFKNLEQIGLTDTLDVWVEKYDIDVEVRVTSLTYDSMAERVTSFNAGSDRAPRQSAIEKKYDDLTRATNDYITSFKNGVQNVMRNTADGLNRKFEGYTEPPAELSSEGDIWFKEIGEGKVEIWIHDGVYWQPLLTEEFANKVQAEVDAAMLDAEEALLKANEVSDDINTAIQNAGFTSLPEAIIEIQGKMDSDRFDQEILDIVTDVNSAKTDASQALTEVQNKVDTFDFDNTVGIINTGIQDAMDEAELATNTLRDSTGQLIKSQDLKVDIDGITSSLTSYAKTTDLNGLATETFVTNKGYQTAAQVSSTLGAYAKTTDLNGLVSQTWVENKGYATASEVSSELSSYAKSSDLTGLATEKYVTTRGYQTASQITTTLSAYEKTTSLNTKLAGKANVGDIPSLTGYAKESWVENKSYATAASVATSLKAYEKITDVNAKLADKADIDDIPDITGLASETWVENKSYATAASVTTQLSSYAKSSQLTGLATETFVTNKGYQTAAQVSTTLSSYAKTSQLTGLATETFVTSKGYQTASQVTTTLSSYAKTTDLSGLATETYVTSRGYQTASQITTTLAAYAKTSQLSGLATETFVTNKGYQTASQVSTTLSSYVKTSTLSGYATVATVNAIKSTADTNKATISTNTGKISTIEQTVGGIQTTVAGKAAQTQVTQLANGLSSVVTDLSNLEIGGRNYFTKSSPIGQSIANSTFLPRHADTPNGFRVTGNSSSNGSIRISNVITENGWWTVSFDIKGSQSVVVGVTVDICDKGSTRVVTNTTNTYTRRSVSVYVDNHSSLYNFVDFEALQYAYFWIDNIKVEKGNRATDWTPAPEDMAAQSQVTQLATLVNTKVSSADFEAQITTLSNTINLRVSKGDVLSQINVEADRTLISSNKILLNANTVSVSGTAWMSGAVIKKATIASASIASLDASKISAGTLSGFTITSPFNYAYDGAIRNQGSMTMTAGQLTLNGTFTHSHGKTYTYLNADKLYSENIMSNGSVRSMFKLDGDGLTVQKVTSKAHYRQDGIHFTDGGNASIRYYDANARIEVGSYNGVSLGANFTGAFYNRLAVGGGADNVDPFVDIYTKLNMRNNFIDNVTKIHLRAAAAPLSGSVINNTNDNWLEMAGRWGTRVGHRSENNATFYVRAEFTTTDIKFYANLNMQTRTIINQSDERLKRDIVYDEVDSLNAIKNWRIAGFNWRDPEATTERQFGVIAQSTPEIASMGENGYLNVNSSKQLQMVTHALQQLETRERTNSETNEEKIHQLQQELSKANRRIEELEGAM